MLGSGANCKVYRGLHISGGYVRKSLWIVGLFLAVLITGFSAPSANADTAADVSFTCSTSCAGVPSDPLVTFPSPNIPINFYGQDFNVILNSLDKSGDTYTWEVESNGSNWYFLINDLTDGFSDQGPSFSISQFGDPFGNGGVEFKGVATPEPSSASLLLVGLGVAFLAWKLRERNGQAAANSAA